MGGGRWSPKRQLLAGELCRLTDGSIFINKIAASSVNPPPPERKELRVLERVLVKNLTQNLNFKVNFK